MKQKAEKYARDTVARMIAAAPDLLEACDFAAEYLRSMCGVDENGELLGYENDAERGVYSTILQAIKKAKGE